MQILRKLFKNKEVKADSYKMPVHIAIIPDGNGRWAKKRGLPRSFGHREGSYTLKRIVKNCDKIGVGYLTVYVFSTENWKRPKEEVDALMALLLEFLKNAEKELAGTSVRIRVIGNVDGLPAEHRNEIARVEKMTEKNTGLVLNIALNYGGRNELVFAVKKAVKDVMNGKLTLEDLDESSISDRLYTAGMPDPDLFIRTSGELRSSNYLLWQMAYTEFWYTDVLWPDFKEEHLMEAIKAFNNRSRRYGGV